MEAYPWSIEINERTGFPENEMARLTQILLINPQPHAITIDEKIERAATEGVIDETLIDRVGCGTVVDGKRCGLPYSAHTSERAVQVELKRDATKEEFAEYLKSLTPWTTAMGVESFVIEQNEFHFT